jgi:hypothetical protein
MGRNYLAGSTGDAANAVLAAAGYNFRRLLEWPALLLSLILAAPRPRAAPETSARRRQSPRLRVVLLPPSARPASPAYFTVD